MDPPVQPQLAHDAQNVHFSLGLQLLTAYSSGNEAASPADPCTGRSWGEGVGSHQGLEKSQVAWPQAIEKAAGAKATPSEG